MSQLQVNELFNVKGLVAVITGGGTGIGLMVAKALDANGATAVYIVGRRPHVLEAAAKQGTNGSIIPLPGDTTMKDSLAFIAARVKSEQGYINVLFANAGVGGANVTKQVLPSYRKPTLSELHAAMWAPPMSDFTKPFAVNVTGTFYTALAFLALLDAGNTRGNVAQRSNIVVTSSMAGFMRGPSAGSGYAASKAATTHMVKQLATYLGPYKIRVNAIAPGIYPSDMTADLYYLNAREGKKLSEEGAVSADHIPLERTGSEEDMAGAALFLMSKAGAYVTGNILVTDGGRLGQVPSTY